MTHQELQQTLQERFTDVTFDEGGIWPVMHVDVGQWKSIAGQLKNSGEFSLDYLFCLTGVDWKTHLSVVYHLRSLTLGHTLVVKVKLDREKPEIDTVSDIWRTAEFHELEAYDLLGILFKHHPGLRRLFLTDDWEGWPLRKDYVDEVNMIKL